MNRRRSAPPLLALALLSAGGGVAYAQSQPASQPAAKHNSNAPIDWDADHLEVHDREHRAILVGNVRAVQEEMTLTADRATANYTGSLAGDSDDSGKPAAAAPANGAKKSGGTQIHRLDATGHVVVTRPTEIARGQFGIYDLDKKLITLIGNVSLERLGPNPSTTRGGRLVIDLNTNRANMDGSAVGGAGSAGTGGRVSGRFTVAQHDDAKPAATAKPAQSKPASPQPAQH